MSFVKYKNIFFTISALLVAASIVLLFVPGLKFGIDFTGGSLLEIHYTDEKPVQSEVENVVGTFDEAGNIVVRETGETGYIIKTKTIDNQVKEEIKSALSFDGTYSLEEDRFNTVGPTLGNELKTKAVVALLVLLVAIIIFIAFAFRQVSKPVSSWKYGLIAVIALAHDVLITIGVFVLMGISQGLEVDTLFVTALLVILGYSINDTIIILDRVRENLSNAKDSDRENKFEEIVDRSLKETITRSINTSITTLLALGALFFIGGEATKAFSLALIVGVIAGSYSSVFLAAPLLTVFKGK